MDLADEIVVASSLPLVSPPPPSSSSSSSNGASTAKVGFAAIQEMARLQEEALMREKSPETLLLPVAAAAVDVTPSILDKDNRISSSSSSSRGRNFTDPNDLSFLRFDPDANCLKLENFEFKAPESLGGDFFKLNKAVAKEKTSSTPTITVSPGMGKFPLDVSTPTHSPSVGRRRFGSFRYTYDESKISVSLTAEKMETGGLFHFSCKI